MRRVDGDPPEGSRVRSARGTWARVAETGFGGRTIRLRVQLKERGLVFIVGFQAVGCGNHPVRLGPETSPADQTKQARPRFLFPFFFERKVFVFKE